MDRALDLEQLGEWNFLTLQCQAWLVRSSGKTPTAASTGDCNCGLGRRFLGAGGNPRVCGRIRCERHFVDRRDFAALAFRRVSSLHRVEALS